MVATTTGTGTGAGARMARRRPVATAVAAAVVIYWAHCVLRMQYHRHCKADLLRVVFMGQSNVCSHIGNVLHIVEVAVDQAIKHVTAHMLSTLRGMFSGDYSGCGGGGGGGLGIGSFGGGGGYSTWY